MTEQNTPVLSVAGIGDAETIANLARSGLEPRFVPTVTPAFVVVPPGHTVRDLEDLQMVPNRIRRAPVFRTAAAFCEYVRMFVDRDVPEPAVIYALEEQLQMVGVLDHPYRGQPRWGEHTPMLQVKATREWQAWLQVTGKRHDQVAFTEFIENHLPEIADPAGADLLTMVKSLDIRKAVQFQSSVRLDNGQVQFTYTEDISGTAAKGTATIHDTFVLGLSPFEGADRFRLTARLRYRLDSGKVILWFDLLRPEDVVRVAWQQLVQQVAADTSLPVLAGQA